MVWNLFVDLPWEEDEKSVDVVHISDVQQFQKLLKRDRGGLLVMFYAVILSLC